MSTPCRQVWRNACYYRSVDQAFICATIAAGSCLACGVIPMLWGMSRDRAAGKLARQLRECMLQRAAEQEQFRSLQSEVGRWRALYYDEQGKIDVQSRKTVLWKRPDR